MLEADRLRKAQEQDDKDMTDAEQRIAEEARLREEAE